MRKPRLLQFVAFVGLTAAVVGGCDAATMGLIQRVQGVDVDQGPVPPPVPPTCWKSDAKAATADAVRCLP